MTQSTENAGYFNLNHHSVHNKVKPTPSKSGLLNRRQQHATYLPQLELPSLPPLSQLLTAEKAKKEKAAAAAAAAAAIENNNEPDGPQVITSATVAAAVAIGMMPDMSYTTAPTQPIYYNNPTDFSNAPADTTRFANDPSMTQLMDPVSAAAAAAAAASGTVVPTTTTATTSFSTNPVHTIMPMDSMYNLPVHSTNPAALTTSNADYMKYEDLPAPPSDTIPNENRRQRQLSNSSISSAEKTYSFVAIPGVNQKKRPRRRYDEIERLYHCNWTGCTKAYGTLNHLNAHVSMQKHGSKRHPAEFKEMRKEWRRQKKEREARKKANEEVMNNQPQQMVNTNTLNTTNSYTNFQPYGQLPPGTMSLNGFY